MRTYALSICTEKIFFVLNKTVSSKQKEHVHQLDIQDGCYFFDLSIGLQGSNWSLWKEEDLRIHLDISESDLFHSKGQQDWKNFSVQASGQGKINFELFKKRHNFYKKEKENFFLQFWTSFNQFLQIMPIWHILTISDKFEPFLFKFHVI